MSFRPTIEDLQRHHETVPGHDTFFFYKGLYRREGQDEPVPVSFADQFGQPDGALHGRAEAALRFIETQLDAVMRAPPTEYPNDPPTPVELVRVTLRGDNWKPWSEAVAIFVQVYEAYVEASGFERFRAKTRGLKAEGDFRRTYGHIIKVTWVPGVDEPSFKVEGSQPERMSHEKWKDRERINHVGWYARA